MPPKVNKIGRVCLYCGGAFEAYPAWVRRGQSRYCSLRCARASKATTTESFWSKVDKTGGPDACWPWIGRQQPDGYGRVSVKNRPVSAHRFAYEDAIGPIPKGLLIRHRCDNRICCNPAHLEPGTSKDNVADMDERGRRNPIQGARHPFARLSQTDVSEIRRRANSGVTQHELAAEYGVSQSSISDIVCRRTWKHVD